MSNSLFLQTRLTRSSGFTLIELMVVVAIIAIMSGFALLSMDFDNRSKKFEEEARRIAALMQLASDEAIYLQKELGIRFGPDYYGFYELSKVKKSKAKKTSDPDSKPKKAAKAHWQPSADKRLRRRPLLVDTELFLEISGVEVLIDEPSEEDVNSFKVKPHVLILSNGELVPDYKITLIDADSGKGFSVSSSVKQPIIVERLE